MPFAGALVQLFVDTSDTREDVRATGERPSFGELEGLEGEAKENLTDLTQVHPMDLLEHFKLSLCSQVS